jgi:hypothetical protein
MEVHYESRENTRNVRFVTELSEVDSKVVTYCSNDGTVCISSLPVSLSLESCERTHFIDKS